MSKNYPAIADILENLKAPDDMVLPTATFEELHMDSLDMVQFEYAIEDRFGIDLDGPDWTDYPKVSDAVALIDKVIGKQLGVAP